MANYEIPVENFDLELTLTCGQTFCWHRIDGELYGEGKPEFYTFRDGEMILVEDKGDIESVGDRRRSRRNIRNVSTAWLSREIEERALGIKNHPGRALPLPDIIPVLSTDENTSD
ncbi:MAG: DNA glycosylase [Candidatus Aenigmatarchaeota archaeon]